MKLRLMQIFSWAIMIICFFGGAGMSLAAVQTGGVCTQNTDCAPPNVCSNGICAIANAQDAAAVAKNSGPQYCIKDGVCQPLDLTTGVCEQGWTGPKTECPCVGGKTGDQCIPLENPLKGNVTDIYEILGSIIRIAFSVIGSLALLMFVWGGFQLLTSAGNAERVQKGTKTMAWAAIGVIAVFASYFVLSNFVTFLTGGAGTP